MIVFPLLLLAAFAGTRFGPGPAAASTTVCGHVIGAETWTAAGSPYLVACDVIVDPGSVLTIQAGVTVLALGQYEILVHGYLFATGSSNGTILFAANNTGPPPFVWRGIRVASNGIADLSNVSVRDAQNGMTVDGYASQRTSLSVRDADLTANGQAVQVHVGAAASIVLERVNAYGNGNAVNATGRVAIIDSRLFGNSGWGLLFRIDTPSSFASLTLRDSEISDNGGWGALLYSIPPGGPAPAATVECNEVARNALGIGVEAPSGGVLASVVRNNIVNNAVQATDVVTNLWDDGAFGNFWSDYTGTDGDGDGIGDTPYVIDTDSRDNRPFMAPLLNCVQGPTPVDLPPGAATPSRADLTGSTLGDVTLSWGLSADDGGGEDDVAAYDLFLGPSYSAAGVGYALLASLPPGTTTYEDVGGGVLDPGSRFYRLVVRDAAGQATASATQFAKYSRSLAAGWHLLSIPIAPSDTDARSVLQTVDYVVARTFVNPRDDDDDEEGDDDDWEEDCRDKPWRSLRRIDETKGFWLRVRTASDLVVAGLVRVSTTIRLEEGWNLVGYPSFLDRTVADALAGVSYRTVEGFDPANPPYYLRRLGPSDLMEPGGGFWIRVRRSADWTIQS